MFYRSRSPKRNKLASPEVRPSPNPSSTTHQQPSTSKHKGQSAGTQQQQGMPASRPAQPQRDTKAPQVNGSMHAGHSANRHEQQLNNAKSAARNPSQDTDKQRNPKHQNNQLNPNTSAAPNTNGAVKGEITRIINNHQYVASSALSSIGDLQFPLHYILMDELCLTASIW